MFGPPLVALPLVKPQSAPSLEMVLIALFLFFMIVQHRRAHEMLLERYRADENQHALVRELRTAVAEVRTLQGILPICASCKRIKNEDGGWEAVESYVRDRTNAEFSHGLCPDCATRDWGHATGCGSQVRVLPRELDEATASRLMGASLAESLPRWVGGHPLPPSVWPSPAGCPRGR